MLHRWWYLFGSSVNKMTDLHVKQLQPPTFIICAVSAALPNWVVVLIVPFAHAHYPILGIGHRHIFQKQTRFGCRLLESPMALEFVGFTLTKEEASSQVYQALQVLLQP
jgi:hypothetical protein